MADLIEAGHHVPSGVKAGNIRALMIVDADAPLLRQRSSNPGNQFRPYIRAESRVDRIKAMDCRPSPNKDCLVFDLNFERPALKMNTKLRPCEGMEMSVVAINLGSKPPVEFLQRLIRWPKSNAALLWCQVQI